MAQSVVSIYNLALNAIGARNNISLPTEQSREAEVCNLWYPIVCDNVQRAAPWPSNKAFKRLALGKERDPSVQWSEADDPEPGFRFAYRTPSDMLYPRYLISYDRFTLSLYQTDKMAIMTDVEQAVLCYSVRQPLIDLWDTGMRQAIISALAAAIAMPLSGKRSVAETQIQLANQNIAEARQLVQNIDNNQHDYTPDWLLARGWAGTMTRTRFMYPFGPLLSVADFS